MKILIAEDDPISRRILEANLLEWGYEVREPPFMCIYPSFWRRKGGKKSLEKPLPTGSERILFIDDEQVLIEIASQMLEQLRYEVVTTRSSVQALELSGRT